MTAFLQPTCSQYPQPIQVFLVMLCQDNSLFYLINLRELYDFMKVMIDLAEFAEKKIKQLQNRNKDSIPNNNSIRKSNKLLYNQELGISTLMDLSASSIGFQKRNQKRSTILATNRSELQIQVLQMQQKLAKTLAKPLKISSTQLQKPHHFSRGDFEQRDEKFRKQLQDEIKKSKASKAVKQIKIYAFGKLYRELQIFDYLSLNKKRVNNKITRIFFNHWHLYVKNEGEKQRVLKMIRQKIIGKRKERQS